MPSTANLNYYIKIIFEKAGIRTIPTGLKHGTVTLLIDGECYECTTFRIDGSYTDSRHPDKVTFTRDIAYDLCRRDFTVNAMAYSPARGLCDPFGGAEDLKLGVIRAVGDPVRRFTEDSLRILRGFRFAARLGFEIEEKTLFGYVYIDNFEEFVLNSDYNPGHKQALTQLSREMERSLSENINIIVMGGTQKYYADTVPMFIKDFSQKIVVNSPANDTKSRRDILTKLINKKNLHLVCKNKKSYEDLINKLVKLTDGFSYVDIKNLINKTETIIVERNKTRAGIGDFIEAYLQISSGRTTLPMMNSDSKKILASHECGHATNLEVMNNVYNNLGKKWFVLQMI